MPQSRAGPQQAVACGPQIALLSASSRGKRQACSSHQHIVWLRCASTHTADNRRFVSANVGAPGRSHLHRFLQRCCPRRCPAGPATPAQMDIRQGVTPIAQPLTQHAPSSPQAGLREASCISEDGGCRYTTHHVAFRSHSPPVARVVSIERHSLKGPAHLLLPEGGQQLDGGGEEVRETRHHLRRQLRLRQRQHRQQAQDLHLRQQATTESTG